jgi:hypothetical protein
VFIVVKDVEGVTAVEVFEQLDLRVVLLLPPFPPEAFNALIQRRAVESGSRNQNGWKATTAAGER